MKLVREADGKPYDYQYAHTMFLECVVNEPGNLLFVDAFLDNLQCKYEHNLRGARFKWQGRRGPFKKAAARGDWDQVLRLGPHLLYRNPWEWPVLRAMADACAAYHYNEPELRYLKNARDGHSRDVVVTRYCAHALTRMGQFDQAILCWHRVEDLSAGDLEAAEMISALTVEKHRVPAGFADAEPLIERVGPPRGVKKRSAAGPEKPPATPAAERSAAVPELQREVVTRRQPGVIPLTERQRLEQAVREEPGQLDHYVQLAEVHTAEGRYQDAEEVLQKALPVSGHAQAILERWEDTTILRMQQRLAIAEQRAMDHPATEADELVEWLQGKLKRLELDIYSRRSQLAPQDHELRYQLGLRLKNLGNYAQAATCFQAAAAASQLQARALVAEGECLQYQRHYAKALRCYLQALDHTRGHGKEELADRKLALYRASVLAIGLGQEDVARVHLEELVDLEPGHADARRRLDKLG
ncbi:MAG: tetratricopeptide repeat protein [Planctomycetota bacterium]|nr:tetratricopeptide repeat protein [Planctomycetota bacterium]